jgi:hypothetical protein
MSATVDEVVAAQPPTAAPSPPAAPRWWRRLPDPLVTAVVLAIAVFSLGGIGSPVWGGSSLSDMGLLGYVSPYNEGQFRDVDEQTINLSDTVDSAIPNAALFGEEIRNGTFASWNPYILGGVPLGDTPNFGIASPVALPYWFLPAWLAPAYVKLLELLVAIGGCYLFLRRLRLSRAAALLGGLAYATSAFMVVWTNWPQTRVAAFIPALFWALECLVQRRRVRDVALVALPVAAMLLGGFPAVTGYALLTAGCYLFVRVLAEYRDRWRRVVGVLAAGAGGVAAGVALVAVQLIPWVMSMSTVMVQGRAQTSGDHIPPSLLLTSIAPFAFGTVNPADPPLYYHVRSFVDESVYVGAAILVLAVAAVALARAGRALLPKAVWGFMVAATLAWGVLIFVGGPPLWLLQQVSYLFSDNSVERARSVLGFLVAVLAAAGFDLLLRRRREAAGRARRAYGVVVWTLVALAGVGAYAFGRRYAERMNGGRKSFEGGHYVAQLNSEVAIGLAFVVVALAAAAFLWWGPRWPAGRVAAAILIPVLVAVQALMWVRPYHPSTEREYFYPPTDVHAYLQERLGHSRFFGTSEAVYGGIHLPYRLRGLQGHCFVDQRFGELLSAMPGKQFRPPPKPATYLVPEPLNGFPPTNPILDRVSVSQYVTPPERTPYGREQVDRGDGSRVVLRPDQPVTVALPVNGPLRGVGVIPVGHFVRTDRTNINIVLRDSTGREVAAADRRDSGMLVGKPFFVPLAAEDVRPGTLLTAEITLRDGPALAVAGRAGVPAVSAVASEDDGLRLAYDDSAIIYERTRALPRVRWAARTVVEPDQQRRLAMLAGGQVGNDEIVLDRPGPAASGSPADVRWINDGMDEMEVAVDAQGAGYVVLADAIQATWTVTVDGRPADLVHADHGLAAVAVPPGSHTVRFAYDPRLGSAGVWISGVTALLLLVAVGVEWWWRRRPRPLVMPTRQRGPAI